MLNHQLPPDTQAILLLCASFGQNRKTEPQPLTLSEYNTLANCLRLQQLTPKNLLEETAKKQLLEMIIPLDPNRIIALLERGMMLSLAVEKWTSQGLWILGRSDPEYPRCLKQKLQHLAPAILYGVGNFELLSQGGLAVVGSRDVDEEGLNYTDYIVQTCAEQGIQIISGGARGVDQTAMLVALNAGGNVVGVLGDSLAKSAVSSKYRNFIKSGNLTLISSYDPDAGFNVGNAMGRNKYIYGLSDYGLIISSSVDEGGTWAGAIEALKKIKTVPVFVRMQGTIPDGNQQLINRGAKPFPEMPFNRPLQELIIEAIAIDQDTLIVVNNSEIDLTPSSSIQHQIKPASEHSEIQKDTPVYPASQTIYEAVLPLIIGQLEQPKDAKSLAELLQVRPSQMQDWLNLAVSQGKVKKNKKPVTYELNQDVSLLSFISNK